MALADHSGLGSQIPLPIAWGGTGASDLAGAQANLGITGGGGGTVTSVSVVTANGVSGSVANPTTTPAITLTLAAITPTSVASSGPITVTSASASALAVGLNGATNPAFVVDASTAASISGIAIKSSTAGVSLTAISSASDADLTIGCKGGASGQLILNGGGGGTVMRQNGVTILSMNALSAQFGTISFPITSPRFLFTGAADAALPANANQTNVYFNSGQTRTHAVGAVALQTDFRVTGSTHAFASASTITDAAAFSVDGPCIGGTNATITNSHGIYVPTLALANVTNGYGINVSAPSGASTLNQAALFTGDVGITTGNIISNTAGKGIQLKSGSNARIGTGTLSGGTLAVTNTSVTANTRVFLTDTSGSIVNVGSLTVVTSAGVGFTVTSTNIADTSPFNWLLMESN